VARRKVSPQLYNTCALLLGPESIARLEMGRCPSPNYQINHSLIFQLISTCRKNQSHLNIQTRPIKPHDQSQLNFPIDHQLINKIPIYNPFHLIRINGHALSRKSS
jgi:hypothetical protein